MPDLKKITLDGLTIDVTDQVVDKLMSDAKAAKDAVAKAEKAVTDAVTAHAAALAAKDGEIAAAKALIPDATALDKLVADRVALVDSARKVMGADYVVTGKAVAVIKREVAAKKFGDAAVTGKDDAYVAAFFDAAMASAGATADRLAEVLADGTTVAHADKASADARAKMIADMKAAHLPPAGQA